MLVKCLLVLLALSSVSAQTGSQIQDTIAEWNLVLQQVMEIYRILQQISEINISEIIADLTTVENLSRTLLFLLDNFGEILPPRSHCLIRVVLTSDLQTQVRILDLAGEMVHYVRLQQERVELEAECDTYNPNTVFGLIAQQNCRFKLTGLNLQITNSNAKIQLQIVALRRIITEVSGCILA